MQQDYETVARAVAVLVAAAEEVRSPSDGARPVVHSPETAQALCDLYGGAQEMDRQYPLLKRAVDESVGARFLREDDEGQPSNYIAVRDVVCTDSAAAAIADVSLVQMPQRLIVTLVLMKNDEAIACTHRVESGMCTLDIEASAASTFSDVDVVRAVVVVSWDVSGGGLCTCIAKGEASTNALDPVIGIDPAHPVQRDRGRTELRPIVAGVPEDRLDRATTPPTPHNTINVCFNRVPLAEVIDYQYGETRPVRSLESMSLDLRGSVKLRPGVSYGELVGFTATLVLPENPVVSGQISYRSVVESRASYVFPTSDGFDFALPTDWETEIPDSIQTGSRGYDISIAIDFTTSDGKPGTARISSKPRAGDDKESHYATVSPIRLYWGCIDAESLVLMADGSERPIKDIQYGDQVRGGNGETARVVNVLRGTERELMRIDLASGRTLLLTPDHPVITERGVQRADALGAADTLRVDYAAGDPPKILYHYAVQGEFDVYGLDLEDADTFIAEGIVVGSIEMQGHLVTRSRARNFNDAPSDVMQELKRLQRELDGLS